MTDQRQASRHNWNSGDTIEDINAGSLQRIADACETMCRDRETLERDYRYVCRSLDEYRSDMQRLMRKNAALRGVITKLKGNHHD